MKKIFLAIAVLTLFVAQSEAAQDYPTKIISIIVPFTAGGPTDTVARLVAAPMSKALNVQVIVENVDGAGGTVGANRAAKSAPDGYTLFLHHIGMATAPALYRKLPYNPITDFEPIGLINEVPMTMVAKKDFPPKDLREMIAYVKANKTKVNLANAGLGAASHLCGTLFMSAIETDLTTIPYKRHRAGHERPAGRAGGHHVRPDHQHHQPDQGREDQGLRGYDQKTGPFSA